MDCLEVIRTRKSVRSFSSETINQEILDQILEAGRLAPSAQNKQCWRFLVVSNPELIKKIAFHSVIGSVNFFLKEAPLIIIACADPAKSLTLNKQDYYLVDTAIAFQQMILAAWNLGIGSCWIGAFDESNLKKLFSIPEHIRIVALSPFGFPAKKRQCMILLFPPLPNQKKDSRLIKSYIIINGITLLN